MPEIPIRFTKGISRLKGAPLDSLYTLSNARVDPFDEVKAWHRGVTADDDWIPNGKPWVKFSDRWFDNTYMDDYFIYRNRLYLTKVEEGEIGIKNRTLQVIDFVDTDSVLEDNQLNGILPIIQFSFGSTLGDINNRDINQPGSIDQKRSWATDDPGIEGITLGRAVDYLFIPIDKFGQAGPWLFVTINADFSTAGATNVSGTDIYTATIEFSFSSLIEYGFDESVFDHSQILVYRSIEYDIDGNTKTSAYSGEPENVALGGFFLEGIATDVGYVSKAYWPFNIQREDSGRSDQLGPVLERSRNHWGNTFDFNRQIGAKAAHMDGGVAIYGNVNTPTKTAITSHRNLGYKIEGTFSMVNGSPDTITRAAGSFVDDGINVGDTIVVNGFATQANNTKYTVAGVTATTITLNTTTTVTSEAAVATAVITTAPLVSYQYRYEQEDGTNLYGSAVTETRYARTLVPWYGENGLVTLIKHELPISSISGSNTITVVGDWTSFFTGNTTNDSIIVTGSASNDGTFTPTGIPSYSAGNTTFTVSESTTGESGAGTVVFYMIWEKLVPDINGRYISAKNVNSELYTFTHGELDWENKSSYEYTTLYGTIFTESIFIREKSLAYMSEVNAPWEVTLNGFRVPDGSQILSISPSRIEEIEQLSSYSFYVFTENAIYAANRDNYDVTLTTVESVIGLKLFSGYPLVEPVKGGVVFFGTDNNLYFMTGRQVTRLDYVVADLFGTVFDIAFDPVTDYLYVGADTGVWIYDMERQIWIGQYELGQDVNDYNIEFEFRDDVYTGDLAGHQFGTTITLTDTITYLQDELRIFSEQSPRSTGLILNLLVDRTGGGGTDTIATAEIAAAGTDWNITGGDITSGDVVLNVGDQIYFEINDPGTPLFASGLGYDTGILKVKGGVGTGTPTHVLGAFQFDPQFKNMNIRYTVSGGLVFEEMDETGDVIPGSLLTQELKGTQTNKLQYVKIDFNGVEFSGVASGTSGTTGIVVASGDTPGHTRDKMSVIEVPQGGIDNYDTQTKLITFISSVGGSGDITLADTLRNAVTSQTVTWRNPIKLTLNLLDSGVFRNRDLGTYRVMPNKKCYLPAKAHRLRLTLENFDTVRELLIFLENSIEKD